MVFVSVHQTLSLSRNSYPLYNLGLDAPEHSSASSPGAVSASSPGAVAKFTHIKTGVAPSLPAGSYDSVGPRHGSWNQVGLY